MVIDHYTIALPLKHVLLFIQIMITLPHFKVTKQPIGLKASTPELEHLIERFFIESRDPRPHTCSSLEKAIQKYPDSPTLYNYLYVAYQMQNRTEDATKILQKTVSRFPDYIFGRVAAAQEAFNEGMLYMVPRYLGPDIHLHQLYPNKEVFHESEVLSFYSVAVKYFIKMNQLERAEERFEILKKLNPESEIVQDLGKKLILLKMRLNAEKDETDKALREHKVASFPTVHYAPTDTMPVLAIPEVKLFYSDEDLPKTIGGTLLKKDRALLISDLQKLLVDAITRYEYFRDKNEELLSFPIHAACWTTVLQAEESLPLVLDLFRQGEACLEYWFNDTLEPIFLPVIFSIGRRQLPLLKAFMLEPNVYHESKNVVAKAVAQIAMQYPDIKVDCIAWFRDVMDGFISEAGNKNLYDSRVMESAITNVVDLRAIELLPQIEMLFEKDLVRHSMNGDFETVKKDLERPWGDWEIEPMPQTSDEYYSGEHKYRKILDPALEEITQEALGDTFNMNLIEELLSEFKNKHNTPEGARIPANGEANKYKNVSKNEPCPCGSGKKYKRCHGM